jgi:hypothetical protein
MIATIETKVFIITNFRALGSVRNQDAEVQRAHVETMCISVHIIRFQSCVIASSAFQNTADS